VIEEDNDADEVVGVSTAQPVSRSIRPSNEANPAGKIRIRIILGYLQNRREQTKLFAGKIISQRNFALKDVQGLTSSLLRNELLGNPSHGPHS
jgi:hypothetical protein